VGSSGVLARQPSCEGHHQAGSTLPRAVAIVKGRQCGRMAVQGEVVVRPRVCRGHGCQALFWVCSQCDRGQGYCSPACRSEARRRQHRAANRRYQQSPEGRLDHRDRQRSYRQRCSPARVTDQSSHSVISPAPFGCGEKILAVPIPSPAHGGLDRQSGLGLRCSICGRPARFVDPFPQISRRR